MKGRNPNVTQLLNLPDVQDDSANAGALKVFLDRSFNLINEYCMGDMTESVCTDRALTNIGCNNSLFTHLVEEHSHFIPFWYIIY